VAIVLRAACADPRSPEWASSHVGKRRHVRFIVQRPTHLRGGQRENGVRRRQCTIATNDCKRPDVEPTSKHRDTLACIGAPRKNADICENSLIENVIST
jgi:hypothetical protein